MMLISKARLPECEGVQRRQDYGGLTDAATSPARCYDSIFIMISRTVVSEGWPGRLSYKCLTKANKKYGRKSISKNMQLCRVRTVCRLIRQSRWCRHTYVV